MASGSPVLVVGSTGVLGSEITRSLSQRGHQVRALVRGTADPAKRSMLERLSNVQLVSGDLKQPASLAEACRGIHTLVTTASATGARQEGDSLETVDGQGQHALLEAARAAGVRRYVYLSFPHQQDDSPLQKAKRSVEHAIAESGLEYVILRPTYFTDVWFSPALGWDAWHGRVQLLGDGTARTSWIAVSDVARYAVAACERETGVNITLELGGPEALSQLQVLELFKELGAPPIQAESLAESALRAMGEGSANSLERTFSALMLTVARGQTIDVSRQLEFAPGPLETVRQYVERTSKLAR